MTYLNHYNLKKFLIILNISSIIRLVLTIQNQFQQIQYKSFKLKFNNQYRYSAIPLTLLINFFCYYIFSIQFYFND
ncbi:unnamed protein product [Paramecium sonneborni]|uniref:Transmembrane protein n=1 Tax=Paramecium sonneborni TaxID=65129 RepID=A0A8S1RPT8_9CILI|nr:unnamed protein product [Paramecium sonneborni]